MPMIDLKNVDIYLEDGTLLTGTVNLMAGYAIGASSIVVDNFTGQIPVGARLSIDGDDRYKVVSTTETMAHTTQITFTPTLAAAVLDDAVVIAYGVFLKIKVGEGNITWNEKKPREYKKDRGRLDQVRDGDEEPMEVSLQLMYEELTASNPNSNPPTPSDVLKRRGAAANWLSTETTDPCAPYAINIRLDHQPPHCTSFEKERVILPKFRYEELDHNPKDGMLSAKGKCNAVEATVTRIASA
jgi:hypothetical protein